MFNYESSPTIIYNNLHDNTDYNIQLDQSTENDVVATYNWWGTTEISAINQTIYDFNNDFNLGTVIFTPFLIEPNPEIPEFPSWAVLLASVCFVIIFVIVLNQRLSKANSLEKKYRNVIQKP